MGPSSDKSKPKMMTSTPAQPETVEVEKIVEVERIVEKEVPVYIEKQGEEKIIHTYDFQKMEEIEDVLTSATGRIRAAEDKLEDMEMKCDQKHEDALKRLKSIEQSIDIHDKTIIHMRQLQASEEEMYKRCREAAEKQEKYNKYCMIAIGISISLSLLATII